VTEFAGCWQCSVGRHEKCVGMGCECCDARPKPVRPAKEKPLKARRPRPTSTSLDGRGEAWKDAVCTGVLDLLKKLSKIREGYHP
jgi:hypothetical protein